MTEKKKLMRIIAPACIVLIIAGIWILKNYSNESPDNTAQLEQRVEETAFPLKITSVDLDAIKAYGIPTVIDFGSDSCIPCKEMAPVLEKLNAEWQGIAAVQFIDVWKHTEGVSDFPISVIPTQVFFNADGTPFLPSDELSSLVEFTLYSSRDTNEHVFTVHQGGVTEEQMRMIFAEMGIE